MILVPAKIANLDHLFPVTKEVVLAFPSIFSDLPWWRGGWMLRGQLVHHVPCILGVQTSSVSSRLETIEDWSLQSHKMLLSMKKCLHVAVPLPVRSFFGSARTGTKGRDLQRCLPGTLWSWVAMEASYIQRSDHGVSNVRHDAVVRLACRRPRLVKKRIPNQRHQAGTTFFLECGAYGACQRYMFNLFFCILLAFICHGLGEGISFVSELPRMKNTCRIWTRNQEPT